MKKSKKDLINITASLVGLLAEIIINFFLSPYIIDALGVEAKGFLSLASNMVSYAVLVTLALNSMSSRFIAVEYHKKNIKEAEKYYNSVFWSNLVIVLLMILPSIFFIIKIENFLDIPSFLVLDVQVVFCVLFLNFYLVTICNVWQSSTFVTNQLYRNSLNQIGSYIVRICLILVLFYLFSPKISYVSIGTLAGSIFFCIKNSKLKKELLPEIKLNINTVDCKKIIILIKSGIWNTISQTGMVLLNSVDLIIANIFIGANAMGIVSLAKTIPSIASNLLVNLASVFMPSMTKAYSEGDVEKLKLEMTKAIKICSVLISIPLAGFLILGREFYSLWVPNQNAILLHRLSILSCAHLYLTSGYSLLGNSLFIHNKLKGNAMIILSTGIINTVAVFFALNLTNWGVYAIVGMGSFLNIFRIVFYEVPVSAKLLGINLSSAYGYAKYLILDIVIVGCVGYIIKKYIMKTITWWSFFVAAILTVLCGIIILLFINFKDKKMFQSILTKYRSPK